ncbi:MAG: outer membrane protein assembly factor BamE [Mariprofundaceae bacterium]
MQRLILIFATILIFSGCMQHKIHQGNVLNEDDVRLIQEGDSKFMVESALGTPAIIDTLHPNRVHYIEDFFDPDTDKKNTRGLKITYNESLRVDFIERYGFDEN